MSTMSPKCTENKVKRTHKVLNLQEKLDIALLSNQGISNSEIGRKLGIPRTTVSSIVKNKAKVLEEVKKSTPLHTKIIRKRHNLIGEMEKVLTVWIEDQFNHNIHVSQSLIQAKAQSIFNALKAEKGEASAGEIFMASRGWFDKFKKRSNYYNTSAKGEAASTENVAEETFLVDLRKIIEDGGYTKQQIFNVDETELFWNKIPCRTFIAEEESMPELNTNKDKLTLLLGANAAGDCKLKPMLIYHSENPWALKNYLKSSLPVHLKSNKKACMTSALFTSWFTDSFKPDVEDYCEKQNIPFKILLLLDNDPSHLRLLIEAHKEIKVVFMPSSTTLVQPMDQGIISSFKFYYIRRMFTKAALDTDIDEKSKHDRLIAFWKAFNILDCIKTVRDAWDEVKECNLKGVWKNLISYPTENFEGFGETVENITSNIVEMALQLELEVEAEDVREMFQSHDQPPSYDDLLRMEDQKILLNAQEDAIIQSKEINTKELEAGIAKMEDAMTYWEQVDPNIDRSSKVNMGLEQQITCYRDLLRERKPVTENLGKGRRHQ